MFEKKSNIKNEFHAFSEQKKVVMELRRKFISGYQNRQRLQRMFYFFYILYSTVLYAGADWPYKEVGFFPRGPKGNQGPPTITFFLGQHFFSKQLKKHLTKSQSAPDCM
jgi:hypothetical protein